MSRHLQALGKTLHHIFWEVLEIAPIPTGNCVHPHQCGDIVWLKDWKKEPLKLSWTGPHLVILENPTAVKVAEITSWIHHTWTKKRAAPTDPNK
jgi:hypothetical protein